ALTARRGDRRDLLRRVRLVLGTLAVLVVLVVLALALALAAAAATALLRLDRLERDVQPASVATVTRPAERLEQALSDPLAGHLHQAQRGDLGDLMPGAVAGQALHQPAQHQVAV